MGHGRIKILINQGRNRIQQDREGEIKNRRRIKDSKSKHKSHESCKNHTNLVRITRIHAPSQSPLFPISMTSPLLLLPPSNRILEDLVGARIRGTMDYKEPCDTRV